MTLEEMLEDLPRQCDKGAKKNAQGYKVAWNGYKCHADVADGGIPVSCVVTAVSVHDSQVAIPLATLTAERVDSLCTTCWTARMTRRRSRRTAGAWGTCRSSR